MSVRGQLAPEILQLLRHAVKVGEPGDGSMVYVFPRQGLVRVADPFMRGDDILVAPVLVEGHRTPAIVFPWPDGGDGTAVSGSTTAVDDVPVERLRWCARTPRSSAMSSKAEEVTHVRR
ncbi:hypothetical protein OG301_35595 [Streptomyces platensis]|uniref:hypothetical protein n=1 Tax=Streptomyces platensis TaxID=58346 RepID=UPI002ED136D8|nr:hypothetical protein OG301_35595 [Streptomyces platensis]